MAVVIAEAEPCVTLEQGVMILLGELRFNGAALRLGRDTQLVAGLHVPQVLRRRRLRRVGMAYGLARCGWRLPGPVARWGRFYLGSGS